MFKESKFAPKLMIGDIPHMHNVGEKMGIVKFLDRSIVIESLMAGKDALMFSFIIYACT